MTKLTSLGLYPGNVPAGPVVSINSKSVFTEPLEASRSSQDDDSSLKVDGALNGAPGGWLCGSVPGGTSKDEV